MSHLRLLISGLGGLLSQYGGWGLFGISYLDSSFLAFPVINDVLLIELASHHPHKAVLYVLQPAGGSVLGALTIYVITSKGRNLFSRRTPQSEKTQIRRWIERNDMISIVAGSLLPPPTPFKVFAIMAGAMQIRLARFTLALAIGRTVRFALEGWIGVHYGAAAQAYLRKNAGWISLAMAVVFIIAVLAYRYVRRRLDAADRPAGDGK